MTSREAPRSTQQKFTVQQVGTETLVYDERRHMAFCLNQSSSSIWRLADGEHSIAEIAAAASLELAAPVSGELVRFAIEQLREDGLLEPASIPDAGMVETSRTISRRAMLQRLGVGGAMLLPAVAAIVAPTAAQAYSGCVDCSTGQATRARRQQSALPPD